MLRFRNDSFLILFFFASSCIIVSEKDKCYEDIERGDKTGGYVYVCEVLAIMLPYDGQAIDPMKDLYLSLCVAQIIEAEKCKGKSNWRPTIDARM